MKIKHLLALAVLAIGGGNAWAYEVPDGYSIKTVFLGTNNDGAIVPEDFESMESLGSEWSKGNFNSIALGNVTEVALPEIDANTSLFPTYVSGKTMNGYVRQGSTTGLVWASYTMSSAVSTGYLVFSGDFCAADYKSNAIYFRFCDEGGNAILTLNSNATSNNATNFQYAVGNSAAVNTSCSSKWRTYNSFRIIDLVVNMETGDVSFTLDYIDGSGVRKQNTINGVNIGTGHNIKSLQIGRYCVSKTDINTHLDNLSLYSVGSNVTTYVNYTVKFRDTEDNIIKEDKEYTNGIVGQVYEASDADLTTFYSNDTSLKYVYKSGQNTSTVADEDASKNVITLVFDKYEKYDYTVNAVNENNKVIKTIIAGSAYTDESPTLGYSKYIENNGIWYETQSPYAVQVTSAAKEKNVTYALANDVVAFTEIGTGSNSSYSGGGFTVWNTKLVDFNASVRGSYKVGIYCVSNGSIGKNHRYEGIYVDDVEVATTDNHDGLLEFDVDLNPGNNLYVLGKGTNNYCDNIDYVVVKLAQAGPFVAGDDATRAIYNPTPETAKTADGWTLEGNGNKPFVYGQLFENWNDKHTEATFNYYQTITGLTNGFYVVGADLYADQGSINGAVGLYASSNSVEVHAPVTQLATLETVSTPVVKVVDGTLTIGVKNWATISANWFHANNFTLTYVGSELASCTRATATGKYGTLCLPYDFNAEGANLFAVTGVNSGVIELTECASTTEGVAGKPYIYCATAASQTFTQKSVTVASPVADEYLVGSFEATLVEAGNYVLQTQNGRQGFYKVSAETPITGGAFKCYLKGEKVGNGRSAIFFDGDETAIEALNALTSDKAQIFDLNGRKLNTLQKGINIVNGVKVLVK